MFKQLFILYKNSILFIHINYIYDRHIILLVNYNRDCGLYGKFILW